MDLNKLIQPTKKLQSTEAIANLTEGVQADSLPLKIKHSAILNPKENQAMLQLKAFPITIKSSMIKSMKLC